MSHDDENVRSGPQGVQRFATTRWSVIIAAGERAGADDPNARDAADSGESLNVLCQTYWFPLYAYVRKRVGNVEEARDLTQAFFERLLEKNYLAQANPARGRFRSFLITAFKNFLSKEWEKARAQKRGGGRAALSLDFQAGDSRFALEPTESLTPEHIYQRQWAMILLERVIQRLRAEYEESGKGEQFERLKDFIIGHDSETTYVDVAEALGSTEAAMKMAAHRMRRRYRELLRDEIADTVAAHEEVDDEIRSLFELFQN